MSDCYFPATRPKARKPHRCVACYHAIPAGEVHYMQDGFAEGKVWHARYHDECWAALVAQDDFDFCPGELDPPARLKANAGGERRHAKENT